MSVIVTLTNAGNVLLPLTSGKIYIQQVRPLFPEHQVLIEKADESTLAEGRVDGLFKLDGMEMAWYEQGYREPAWPNGEISIEPGESEELQYDFLLDGAIQTVKVISYFKNEKRKDQEAGWTKTTMYNLQKSDGQTRKERNKSNADK